MKKTGSFVGLTPSKSVYCRATFNYLAAYDHAAGKKNVYTLMILTSDDPVVIGRELPLADCVRVIGEFEQANVGIVWFGDRRSALKAVKRWRNYEF